MRAQALGGNNCGGGTRRREKENLALRRNTSTESARSAHFLELAMVGRHCARTVYCLAANLAQVFAGCNVPQVSSERPVHQLGFHTIIVFWLTADFFMHYHRGPAVGRERIP